MRKFKLAKILSAFLAVSLFMVLLAACGDSGSGSMQTSALNSDSSSQTDSVANTVDDLWTGDVSKVVMTYLTGGTVPVDIDMVVAAINEITIPKIGVEVEFKPISVFEAPNQYTTWIAGKEKMDLMCVAFTNLANYVNQGMIEPLDDLIASSAPHIAELSKEFPIYDAAQFEGVTYGVSTVKTGYGNGGSYIIKKSALDNANLDYQDQQVVTLDELGEIFAAVKEAEPDVYPCGVSGMASAFGYVEIFDTLGETTASGVLMGTDSTDVINLFETNEYYSYLQHLREWYQSGYIMREAATSDMNAVQLMDAGVTSGHFTNGQLSMKDPNQDLVQLQLLDPYYAAISSASDAFWTIPVTSSEPEAAMRFLNEMYLNKDIVNLIIFGIEGEHYVLKENGNTVYTDFPEGKDATTVGYYTPVGVYGDQRIRYRNLAESLFAESLEEFSEKALANPTKGVGFVYDSSNMTSQIIAVQGVILEYQGALETGTADLDVTYPEFLQKLKSNGIDDIIADKQAQFDVWLAQQ